MNPSDSTPLPTRRQLLHRIAVLEARLNDLESTRPQRTEPPNPEPSDLEWPEPPTPITPVEPVPWRIPPDSAFERCATCGGRYADMGLYSCGNADCPSRATYTS